MKLKKMICSAVSMLVSLALVSGNGAVIAANAVVDEGTIDTTAMMTRDEFDAMTGGTDSGISVLSNYNFYTYRYDAGLNSNNAAVYDALLTLRDPSLDQIVVKLPSPVKFTLKATDDTSEALFQAVFGACSSGMDALSYDAPEIFWWSIGNTAVGARNVTYTQGLFQRVTYTVPEIVIAPGAYDGFADLDEILEYKDKLEDAVESFEVKGNTYYDKLKSIHDKISRFTYYDLQGRFSGSALSALVEKGAVCEGYSKGFKLICDKLDIPCVCIFGNYNEEDNSAHMWNYVRMEDGYWYAIDLTWDDYDGDYGIEIIYDYFLRGSDFFFDEHSPTAEYVMTKLKYPTIAKWDYGKAPADITTAPPVTTTTKVTTAATTKPTTTTTTKTTTTTTKTTTTTTSKTTTTTTTTTTKPTTTTTKTTTMTTSTSVTTTTYTKPTTTEPVITESARPTTSTNQAVTTATRSATTTATKPVTTTVRTTVPPVTTTTEPDHVYEYGDLNRDGKVSVADLVYCARHVLGSERSGNSCDLNDDGRVDVYDMVYMRRILIYKLRLN